MKTLIKNIAVLGFIFNAILTVGCSKSSDSGGAATTAYVTMNGSCYASGSNTVVDPTYCANNGYSVINGVCYQTSTNQPVATALCTNNTGYGTGYNNGYTGNTGYNGYNTGYNTGYQGYNTGYTGYSSNACYGYYYYGSRTVTCYGSTYNNCYGYALISATTGQQVLCQ